MPPIGPPAREVLRQVLDLVDINESKMAFPANGIQIQLSETGTADDPANGVPLPGCIALYAHGDKIIARADEDGPMTEIQTNVPPAVQPLATGSLNEGRRNPGVCLLADGRIFICGGLDISDAQLDTCEIYDPATGLFTPVGNLTSARGGCTAVLLDNGEVLIVGSISGSVHTVETYDPETETCTDRAEFGSSYPTENGTAIKLDSGLVLIFGGDRSDCDLYDEDMHTLTPTGSMSDARTGFAAFKDSDGNVHAVSGILDGSDSDTTEVYDDVGGTWSSGPAVILQREFATVSFASGIPVLIGGYNTDLTAATATCEKLIAGVWTATGSLDVARYNHKSIALSDDTILAIGGQTDGSTLTATVELFTTATWATKANIGAARAENFGVKMSGDTALIGGGRTVIGGGTILTTVEIYGAQSTVALTSDVGVTLKKIIIPPTPAAGYETIFLDAAGAMKIRKSDGTIVAVGGSVDPDLSVDTITTTGDATIGGNITANSGNVSGCTGTFTSGVTCGALILNGTITGSITGGLTLSGDVSACSGIFSVNVSANNGIFTGGDVSSATVTTTGDATIGGIVNAAEAVNAPYLTSTLLATLASIATSIVTKTDSDSPYAADDQDSTIIANPAVTTTLTVNLPAAGAQGPGRIYTFKLIGLGTLVIDADGSETIDGAAMLTVTTLNQSVTIQSDGSNWFIIGS